MVVGETHHFRKPQMVRLYHWKPLKHLQIISMEPRGNASENACLKACEAESWKAKEVKERARHVVKKVVVSKFVSLSSYLPTSREWSTLTSSFVLNGLVKNHQTRKSFESQ